MGHKQEGITVIGQSYLDSLIFYHLKESYEVYKGKDFTKKQFQVSINENKHATAGIVLLAIGIESYRNLLFYGEKEKINRNSVGNDIAKIINIKDKSVPIDFIKNALIEIFIIRDIIVHSHVYKVNIEFDDHWNLKAQRHIFLKDQYGDKKLGIYSNSRTKKTDLLKLNIQPIRIGFEDYFRILIILDLLIGIIDKYWSKNIIGYHPLFQIDGYWFPNLSELYSFFYDKIPSNLFKNKFRAFLSNVRNQYLPLLTSSDSFLTNICPSCKEFGFIKLNNVHNCRKCGCKIELTDQ